MRSRTCCVRSRRPAWLRRRVNKVLQLACASFIYGMRPTTYGLLLNPGYLRRPPHRARASSGRRLLLARAGRGARARTCCRCTPEHPSRPVLGEGGVERARCGGRPGAEVGRVAPRTPACAARRSNRQPMPARRIPLVAKLKARRGNRPVTKGSSARNDRRRVPQSDSGRHQVGGELPPHGSFGGPAAARLTNLAGRMRSNLEL